MTDCHGMTESEGGFALLEVLIAAAIIAAMLGVTFEAVLSGARNAHDLQDRRQAMLVAQSVLASVGQTIALAPGTMSGAEDRFGWRTEVEPYAGADAPRNASIGLFDVTVLVSATGSDRPLATLRTLRVAR